MTQEFAGVFGAFVVSRAGRGELQWTHSLKPSRPQVLKTSRRQIDFGGALPAEVLWGVPETAHGWM